MVLTLIDFFMCHTLFEMADFWSMDTKDIFECGKGNLWTCVIYLHSKCEAGAQDSRHSSLYSAGRNDAKINT